MPVRLRITLLFVSLVIVILSLVCTGIYYISYQARVSTIKTRLTNRAITTARLLGQREMFDQKLVMRIDSLTTISLKNKSVQAYDYQNREIYYYSDAPNDTLQIATSILDDARVNGTRFFKMGEKEAVAYHYADPVTRIVVVSAAEDVDGKQNLRTLFRILLISFLFGTIFALITGYIFSARLLIPIMKITSEVEEISAQNLTRRIKPGNTKDEWYKLAFTLNELLNRLQESFELQRRFISNASHELSTPLTSITSQLEVAMQRPREANEYLAVMQSMYQDVRHMSKLTQTLLEFARTAGNAGGLEITLVRLDEIILRLPVEVSKLNSDFVVKVSFGNLPEDEENLLVFGNEPLLTTAIRNIVLNACKYSVDQTAHVHLNTRPGEIIVSVKDNGKGIAPEEIKNIFQPFYRVEENIAGEGFGLGLSLADRIVKLHKGNLSVESEPGKGTTFSILLPSARALR